MKKSFFITGTDTGVGKTIFSAILAARAAKLVGHVHYHKAINTGEDNDANTVRMLMANPNKQSADLGIGLRRPLSPHLSAHYQNTRIDFMGLVRHVNESCHGDINIVEGAGGLMVPINHRHLIIDLIKELALPTILVARTSLGTINHTLLSLNALRQKGIKVAAVAMLGHENKDNERSIAFFGDAKNIAYIPFLPNIQAESIERMADSKRAILDRILGY
jgi:dethiobiotin synthase